MKINVRQEIAMWVLGLLWTGLGVVWLLHGLEVTSQIRLTIDVLNAQLNMLHEQMLLVVIFQVLLLVPIGLIIFSLRDRKKPD